LPLVCPIQSRHFLSAAHEDGCPAGLHLSRPLQLFRVHIPTLRPPPTQTTSLTPNPPQTSLLPPQPSRNKQPEFHSGLRNTDSLSAPKSTVTVFTSDKRQSNATPPIILNDSTLSLERRPLILGVTFDPPFTFGPHHSPPQHSKSSCWHQLEPAKRNKSHHLQIHYPIRNNLRCSHLVPQHHPLQHKKTTDFSEHRPPHCHWLREDYPHWAPSHRNPSSPPYTTPFPCFPHSPLPEPSNPPIHRTPWSPPHPAQES